MRTKTAVAVGLLTLLITAHADAQRPRPEGMDKRIQELKTVLSQLPEPLPERFPALSAPPKPSWETAPLPEPSLTEPFEIGEAWYDPARVDDAVVSMLALMRIRIVPDAAAGAGPKGTSLTLSESEVRALIDMGREDLESADDIENLPYSFADLHRAVADLLPGVSIEQMAQAYTRAYEMSPEDFVAKALMGRPIEAETTLTRTQIWFLLMDGFAGAAASGARWGTADRQLPDAAPPNPEWSAMEWREVLARLPLITASRLVTMSAPDVVTQGTTANTAPVNVTARMNASAPPLVSRLTGRTLIAPRAGSLAGHEVTWRVRDESMLEEIGTITSPTDDAVRVGADGLARFVFQPGVDATNGVGETVEEWETVEARFETRALVASAYAVPVPLARLTLGTSRTRANLHLRWRSSHVLRVLVLNNYDSIKVQIPGVGGGTRKGQDYVFMKLVRQKNGSYFGIGIGWVNMLQTLRQTLRGPTTCQNARANDKQMLKVLATPIREEVGPDNVVIHPGFGPTKELGHFWWLNAPGNPGGNWLADEPPDGGYYQLEFFPWEEPPFRSWDCVPYIPAGDDRKAFGASTYISFNDAQWTTSGQGYGIALRARGPTAYTDCSSCDPLTGTPLAGVKALLQLTGESMWVVLAARTSEEFNHTYRLAFQLVTSP